MKTKKYESIMNKAMKAAMNYENPDDQINEFIRFFGEHIGSERIYIFEDNIRKKVTNNTYELSLIHIFHSSTGMPVLAGCLFLYMNSYRLTVTL